jgi:hypothetical protein
VSDAGKKGARKASGDPAGRPRSNGTGGRRDELPRRLGDIIMPALDKLAGGDEARAYAAWARVVGDPVSGGTRPKAFRRGQLTIECASSVWASELTYLGPQILRRMDEVAPGHPVERFRFIVGRLSPPPEPVEPSAPPSAAEARDAARKGPAGQDSHPSAANENHRHERAAPDEHDAARLQAEAVQDGRLRAAIEAALRRSSEEPREAPSGGPPSG